MTHLSIRQPSPTPHLNMTATASPVNEYKTTLEFQQDRLSLIVRSLVQDDPFFLVLALLARPTVVDAYIPNTRIPVKTACTDGKFIWFSQRLMESCSAEQVLGILRHEVLHVSQLHPMRGRGRDAKRYNIAGDIWINGIVHPKNLPMWTIRCEELEQGSTEEIYTILRDEENRGKIRELKHHGDLMYAPVIAGGASGADEGDLEDCPECGGTGEEGGGGDDSGSGSGQGDGEEEGEGHGSGSGSGGSGKPCPCCGGSGKQLKPEAQQRFDKELQNYWRGGLQQAAVAARRAGKMPAGMERIVADADGVIDWRRELWEFVQPSMDDYGALDPRLNALGIASEMVDSLTVKMTICVDTSGSIGNDELAAFRGEIRGIQESYPKVEIQMYYADAAIYGPYELEREDDLPKPEGGGGTDFRPFFSATEEAHLRIYLTDGYGAFPEQEPEGQTLWVVMPGGLPDEGFPWGRVLRMVE